jgi:hypothetical protein
MIVWRIPQGLNGNQGSASFGASSFDSAFDANSRCWTWSAFVRSSGSLHVMIPALAVRLVKSEFGKFQWHNEPSA